MSSWASKSQYQSCRQEPPETTQLGPADKRALGTSFAKSKQAIFQYWEFLHKIWICTVSKTSWISMCLFSPFTTTPYNPFNTGFALQLSFVMLALSVFLYFRNTFTCKSLLKVRKLQAMWWHIQNTNSRKHISWGLHLIRVQTENPLHFFMLGLGRPHCPWFAVRSSAASTLCFLSLNWSLPADCSCPRSLRQQRLGNPSVKSQIRRIFSFVGHACLNSTVVAPNQPSITCKQLSMAECQ
jgi:hypothetical protein